MNYLAPTHRRPSSPTNGHATSESSAPDSGSESSVLDAVVAQARELDLIFKSLARRVLIDDDPAAELPLRQLRVCLALLERPRAMSDLSRELGVSQSAITQIADRLEVAGMVARTLAAPDRRVRSLQLTARARKMLRAREESHLERVAVILERMSPAARGALLSSMHALREACDADSQS